jgi:tetratricopeptide (TPR) repeat protein
LTLLGAGAVLGSEFSFELMQANAGLNEDQGLAALEEVLAHRLLRDTPGRRQGELYRFVHDKIRDVVYRDLNETRRRVFHRRAFEKLALMETPAAVLAHQALVANLNEAAWRFSLKAGDEALKLFATQDAILAYGQALKSLEEHLVDLDKLEASEVEHLYLQIGWAYELQTDFGQARQFYETLLNYAQNRQEIALEGKVLNRLATLAAHDSLGLPRALTLLEQARRSCEAVGDTLGLAESEWNTAQLGFYARSAEALNHAQKALKLAQGLEQPELTARCLNAASLTNLAAGFSAEASGFASQARVLYHQLGNKALEADSMFVTANAHYYSGEVEAGISLANKAYAISTKIGNQWGRVNSLLQLAIGLRESGAYSQG